jgi:hypothetical protein
MSKKLKKVLAIEKILSEVIDQGYTPCIASSDEKFDELMKNHVWSQGPDAYEKILDKLSKGKKLK